MEDKEKEKENNYAIDMESYRIYDNTSHSMKEQTRRTNNPLVLDRVEVGRLSTDKIFDTIREELKQIYESTGSHIPYLQEMLLRENEEIKNNEDTPYTMSLGSSRRNTWDGIEDDKLISNNRWSRQRHSSFKKYSFREIEDSLVKFYKPTITKLDILIIYLNGQKHVYLQSNRITQLKLNLLYLPSVLFTSFTTFFAPFSYASDIWWGNIVLSLVNGVILVLIALISYSRFESTASTFFQLYSEYEKLNMNMEFFYNRIMEEKKENHATIIQKMMTCKL